MALGVLLEGLVSGFYYALIAVFTAVVYVRLREIKEGLGAAELAQTID